MKERAFDKIITFLCSTFLFFNITLALTCPSDILSRRARRIFS
jgi:hypothetical protein